MLLPCYDAEGSGGQCFGLLLEKQKIDGFLRLRGGSENKPLVAFKRMEPVLDVTGMILAGGGGHACRGAAHGGAQFCHQFLKGIVLAAEFCRVQAVKAVLCPCPVGQLVKKRAVIIFSGGAGCGVFEHGTRGHHDVVLRGNVIRLISAMPNIGGTFLHKPVCASDILDQGRGGGFCTGCAVISFHLRGIEYGRVTGKDARLRVVLSIFGFDFKGLVKNNRCADFSPLLVCCPYGKPVFIFDLINPE